MNRSLMEVTSSFEREYKLNLRKLKEFQGEFLRKKEALVEYNVRFPCFDKEEDFLFRNRLNESAHASIIKDSFICFACTKCLELHIFSLDEQYLFNGCERFCVPYYLLNYAKYSILLMSVCPFDDRKPATIVAYSTFDWTELWRSNDFIFAKGMSIHYHSSQSDNIVTICDSGKKSLTQLDILDGKTIASFVMADAPSPKELSEYDSDDDDNDASLLAPVGGEPWYNLHLHTTYSDNEQEKLFDIYLVSLEWREGGWLFFTSENYQNLKMLKLKITDDVGDVHSSTHQITNQPIHCISLRRLINKPTDLNYILSITTDFCELSFENNKHKIVMCNVVAECLLTFDVTIEEEPNNYLIDVTMNGIVQLPFRPRKLSRIEATNNDSILITSTQNAVYLLTLSNHVDHNGNITTIYSETDSDDN
ncbi:hypothetical protein SNEBB_010397 [Seison nebaliae]|nr:hypothetical protein SNEBB_010397 [Seison nebaliae]